MEIESIKIEDLKPYENNPRLNDDAVEGVANSIREFGFKVPIVIDRDNVIVCGHTRYLASLQIGLERVPCIRADDLSEEQVKAFRLADNKVSEVAQWDMGKLSVELAEIDNIDMEQFGFEDLEIDVGEPAEVESESEFDDIEKFEKHYGVPYQGNKSRIADIIINILPAGKRLVDLFGGGGAITHCGMLSGKWERYLYNDINPMITTLFLEAVHGVYHDEHRVITREDFESLKDTDPYVKYIWSFGNNGSGYLWGKDIEDIKLMACHAIADETLQERRLAYMRFVRAIKEEMPKQRLDLHSFESLQVLQRLEALEKLEVLQRLEVSNISYLDYEYQDGDVVYCDVPYEQLGKAKCSDYGVDFDSLAFYEWAKSQPYQIYFSSYEISDQTFDKVKIKSVASLIGATTNDKKVTEYLYSNKAIK